MKHNRGAGKAGTVIKLVAALMTMSFASHGHSKSLEEEFRLEVRLLPGEVGDLEVNICYEGATEKEIRGLVSRDLKIVAAGNWKTIPQSSSVFEAGVGPLIVERMRAGKCITSIFNLKELFASVGTGKNTVTFELRLTSISDNKTIKLRKTVELDVSAEQAKYFEEQAALQKK
jgi:hypothetical protein